MSTGRKFTVRRANAFLLCLVLLLCALQMPVFATADRNTVSFGRYEQDGDGENGMEAIQWLAIASDGDRVLLLSDMVLDCREYSEDGETAVWKQSAVRRWLNEEFLEAAFSDEEKTRIVPTESKDDSGNAATDMVFLLSLEEVQQLLNEELRSTASTKFAQIAGALTFNGGCDWMLRTQGTRGEEYVCDVDGFGSVMTQGSRCTQRSGIRPALWATMEGFDITINERPMAAVTPIPAPTPNAGVSSIPVPTPRVDNTPVQAPTPRPVPTPVVTPTPAPKIRLYLNELPVDRKQGKVWVFMEGKPSFYHNENYRDLDSIGVQDPVRDCEGYQYTYGISMDGPDAAEYYMEYDLNGKYTKFTSWVAPWLRSPDESYSKSIQIYCDGELVFVSQDLRKGSQRQWIELDVSGVNALRITYPPTNGYNDLAVLFDAKLEQ